MDITGLIERKKRGGELGPEEIRRFTLGYGRGEVPDYQAAALLMALVLRGMSLRESAAMALAIRDSGLRLDWSEVGRPVVDKHSTGGVGDKVTLVLAPWMAAAGLGMGKLSGRGLGFTGGTIDKLESIPGFITGLPLERVIRQVAEVGVAVFESGAEIAPADHALYALRDVTATVDSPGLIAASVVGKKLAGGAGSIVIDLKVGRGAFMESREQAEELARYLIACGEAGGVDLTVVMSRMDRPLGFAVGNGVEVWEALRVAESREAEEEVYELTLALGVELYASALGVERQEARRRLEEVHRQGLVREKMEEWIAAQGGELAAFEETVRSELPGRLVAEVAATEEGFVTAIDPRAVGELARDLGAGRRVKGEAVDPLAGVVLMKRVGDEVERGEPLARLYGGRVSAEEARRRMFQAVKIGGEPPRDGMPLVLWVVG